MRPRYTASSRSQLVNTHKSPIGKVYSSTSEFRLSSLRSLPETEIRIGSQTRALFASRIVTADLRGDDVRH
jgi:hypothetical protein